jgi:uncharacterized membrane protein
MAITETRWRTGARWVLALFYIAAGIIHLRSPDEFLLITPEWVPYPAFVIAFTGVCEILGGIALLTGSLRRAGGIGLALYAVCVYPANIKHAMEGIALAGVVQGWGYHAPRLAFQPIFVWWALWVGGVIEWPFRRSSDR